MAKANVWNKLKGKKETATKKVEMEIFDVEAEFTIKYREPEDIQKINDKYDKLLPDEKVVPISLGDRTIQVKIPAENEEEQELLKKFKDHPDVETALNEYQEKAEPVSTERSARIACEFLIEDERPDVEDVEEKDTLKYKGETVEVTDVTDDKIEIDYNDNKIKLDKDDETLPAKILLDRLRLTDINKIVQPGMKMLGLDNELEKARKNS